MERNHICKVDLRACVVRSYSVMISTKLLCSSANIISSMYSTTCIVMITVSFKLTMMTGLLKCLVLPPSEIFSPKLISIVISSRRCAGWLGLWIHMEKDRDHNIILNYQLGLWIHVGTRSKYDIELSNYYTNTRDHMVTWNIWLLIGPWLCIATSKTKPDGK